MIYFLRCEQRAGEIEAGWIKIGTTTRLSMRLKQITAEIGHTPTVLAVLDGAFAEEYALHEQFAESRQIGEWFDPCADLLRLIETEGRKWDGVDEKPASAQVKLDKEIVWDAKTVAIMRGVTLFDYLNSILRLPVKRDLDDEFRRIAKEKGWEFDQPVE
jgi:hypothetical protein